MASIRRMQALNDDLERATPVLVPELLREMYRSGLELGARESAVFHVQWAPAGSLVLVVRNGREGVVEVVCSDERVAAQLRRLIGFRVAVACAPEVTAPPPSRTVRS